MNIFKRPSVRYARPRTRNLLSEGRPALGRAHRSVRVQAKNWRLMAFGSLVLAGGFAAALVWQSTQGAVVPWVVQIDKFGEAQAVASAVADYRPTDPQIAWHLGRFIEQVRSIPADAVIVRQNWLRAYDYTTDRGAIALNDYGRANDPSARSAASRSPSKSPASSAPRRTRSASPGRSAATRTASSPRRSDGLRS